ncbi:MAG: aldo/keto reductase [Candidatus Nanopelagicales bacterium]
MPNHRELVDFGRGGLRVSKVGLGTAPLGGMFSSVEESSSDDLIKTATSVGVNYFDTAPFYGHTKSEKRLGRGLHLAGAQSSAIVSTKVGRILVEGEYTGPTIFRDLEPCSPVFDYSAKGVRRSFEESLERMKLDHVDILFIHDPENHMDQAIDEAYPELDKMRSEGLVKSIGVGINFSDLATRFVRETDIDIVLIAGRYTLLEQTAAKDLLPAALERNVSVLAAGVFNSGVLVNPNDGATYDYAPASKKIIDHAKALHEAIDPFGVPVSAVGLQFPLRHPAVKAILTGARTGEELKSNLKDFAIDLPKDIWDSLETQGLIQPVER